MILEDQSLPITVALIHRDEPSDEPADRALLVESHMRFVLSDTQKRLCWSCLLCLAFMLLELAAGIYGHSLAVLTDAAHMLSDLSAFVISLFAIHAASLPGTPTLSFGYQRAEILGALLSILAIWVLTAWLVVQAIHRLVNPEPVKALVMIYTAIFGVITNLILVKIFSHKGGHTHLLGCSHTHPAKKARNVLPQAPDSACEEATGRSLQSADPLQDLEEDPLLTPVPQMDEGQEVALRELVQSSLDSQPVKRLNAERVASVESANTAELLQMAWILDIYGLAMERVAGFHPGKKGKAASGRRSRQLTGEFIMKQLSINSPSNAAHSRGQCLSSASNNSNNASKSTRRGDRDDNHGNACDHGDGYSPDHHHDHDHHDHDHHDHDHDHEHGHVHSHDHNHGLDQDSNDGEGESRLILSAAYLHALGDMLQNIGVLVAGALIYLKPTWLIADPICTLTFAIFVIATTVGILKDATTVLMEGTPAGIAPESLVQDLADIPNVIGIHDVHIWSLSVGHPALACHLVVDNPAKAQKVLDKATAKCQLKHGILHTTIQVDFSEGNAACETNAHSKCHGERKD